MFLRKIFSRHSTWQTRADAHNRYRSWRIGTMITMGIMAAAIIVGGWFLYSSVYQTLEDARTVIVLHSTGETDTLNLADYAKAVELIRAKTTFFSIPRDLRNPFSLPIASTTESNFKL